MNKSKLIPRPKVTCSFPDDHHETIRFECPCGWTAERTIDLSCGGEVKTRADKAVIEAAIEWCRRDNALSRSSLRRAIRSHPDYKEEVLTAYENPTKSKEIG